jgi:mannosyl-oligosaccharide alpha-1,2-mannosidase
VDSLLAQSEVLADALKYAFDTPSQIPLKTLLLAEQGSDGSRINTVSSIGTLILEWTRLSDLTGKKEYAALVDKAMVHLLDPKPKSTESYPGITGTWLNVDSGFFTDDWGSWGAGGDSFYEYLIKSFAYDQSLFGLQKNRWIIAADSVIKTLAETPPGTNLTLINLSTGTKMDHESSHLECFAGGNFIFAGKILNDTRYVDFGLKLTESCHDMYIRTATRIGPEKVRWPSASMTPEQWTEFEALGYAITDASYKLRPEVMESYYYAYRVTKDRKYQDWAWDAFVAIVAHTKTRNGFAPISNVNKVGGGWKQLRQESFFFSELLKYAYLIFSEVRVVFLLRDDFCLSCAGSRISVQLRRACRLGFQH